MYGYKMLRGSISDWMAYEDDTEQGLYVMPDGKPFLVYDSSITPRKYTMYVGNGVNTIAELLQSSPSPGDGVQDVQINGTSIVVSDVANIPIATTVTQQSPGSLGVVKAKEEAGTQVNASGELIINPATPENIRQATQGRKPIVPTHQHEAAFYGLAAVAGDTTQATYPYDDPTYPVGTYTDTAKTKIQEMLGVVTLTQTEYDSLTIKNPSTYYVITED